MLLYFSNAIPRGQFRNLLFKLEGHMPSNCIARHIFVIACAFLPVGALADQKTWTGGPSGAWDDPAAWVDGVPGPLDVGIVEPFSSDINISTSGVNLSAGFIWLKGTNGHKVMLGGHFEPSTNYAGFIFENGSSFTGDLTLHGTQDLSFDGGNVVLDERIITLDGGALSYSPRQAGEQLEIGPDSTMTITGLVRINPSNAGNVDNTVLKGGVTVDAGANYVEINALNRGTITVESAGTFAYGGANQGTITVKADMPLSLIGSSNGADSNGTFEVQNQQIEFVNYRLGSNGFDAFQVANDARRKMYVTGELDLGGNTVTLNHDTGDLVIVGGTDGDTGHANAYVSNGTLAVNTTSRIDYHDNFSQQLFGRFGGLGYSYLSNVHVQGDLRIDAGREINGIDGTTFTGTVAGVNGVANLYLPQTRTQDNVTFTDVSLFTGWFLNANSMGFESIRNRQLTLGTDASVSVSPGRSITLSFLAGGQIINQGTINAPTGSTIELVTARLNDSGVQNARIFENQGQINIGGELKLDSFRGSGELFATFKQTAGNIQLNDGMISSVEYFKARPVFQLLGGSLTGNGTINTPFLSDGTIAPGNSVGELAFGYDVTLQDDSVLEMEIAGPGDFDVINVTGSMALDGQLRVSLLNGYDPTTQPGVTYTLISAGNISGAFANGAFVTADGRYTYEALISNDSITLRSFAVVPEPATGALLTLSAGLLLMRRRRSMRWRTPSRTCLFVIARSAERRTTRLRDC